MKDLWHELLKVIDYHRGIILGIVLALAAASCIFGCDVTTTSLIDPHQSVTPQQLEGEIGVLEASLTNRHNDLMAQIATFNAEADRIDLAVESAKKDLKKKYELRDQLVRTIGGFAVDAADGTFNPISALTTVLSLLSFGAAGGLAVDNIRKSRVIRILKQDSAPAA